MAGAYARWAHGRSVTYSRLGALALGLVLLAATAAVGEVQPSDLAMVSRAAELHSLTHAGATAVLVKARIKLLGLVSGSREGDYVLSYESPERWFEQTRFPGYSELAGVNAGERWRKRSGIDKPFRMHQASRSLDLVGHLRLAPGATVSKSWRETTAGQDVACLAVSPSADMWQKDMSGQAAVPKVATDPGTNVSLCFAVASGALVRADYGFPMTRYEFEGVVKLGDTIFPKVARCFEGKDLAVETTIEELAAADAQPNPAAFAPPRGADRWPVCAGPVLPRVVAKREAEHPSSAKAAKQFGTVICLAEVGTDGIIHDLAIVQCRSGLLWEAVQTAVAGLRYVPAACNGQPIPFELYLTYTFPP